MTIKVRKCTKADFDQIILSLEKFWEGSPGQFNHNPMFLNEFPDSALVIKQGNKVLAYLFGLIGQSKSTSGYVSLIATRRGHRNKGYASALYAHFENYARELGCKQIKAITSGSNKNSRAFHSRIGMTPKFHKNYAGPTTRKVDRDRWIFIKRL